MRLKKPKHGSENGSITQTVTYALNFAKSNANQEVAPYILYTEAYDATLSLLDTVIKDFTPKVKNSRYGKQLEDYLAKRRAKENN